MPRPFTARELSAFAVQSDCLASPTKTGRKFAWDRTPNDRDRQGLMRTLPHRDASTVAISLVVPASVPTGLGSLALSNNLAVSSFATASPWSFNA